MSLDAAWLCYAELLIGGGLALVNVADSAGRSFDWQVVLVGVCIPGDRVWGAHHTVMVPGMHDKLLLCEFVCLG